jgi:uncharacterized membrane protein
MYLDLFLPLAALLLNAAGMLFFPGSPFLLPLGIISLFFAPGYLLLAALYPHPRSLPSPLKFLGAFGLSVVVSSLLLLLVAYTAGFTTLSAFIALLAWALPLFLLTALRRRNLPPPRPAFLPTRLVHSARATHSLSAIRTSQPAPPPLLAIRKSQFASPRPFPLIPYSLSVILILSLARLIAASTTAIPQFTEFYILGPGRLLGDLPERVEPGATPEIFLGIANHEGRPVDYRAQIQLSGFPARPLPTLSLQDGASWEEKIALPSLPDPDRRKITLTLYKDADPSPYRTVYLWLNGADPNAAAHPAASTFPAKKAAIPDPAVPTPDADQAPPGSAAALPTWLANAAMAVLVALLAIKEVANASEDPRCHRLSRRLNLPILPLFFIFALIIFTRLIAALR